MNNRTNNYSRVSSLVWLPVIIAGQSKVKAIDAMDHGVELARLLIARLERLSADSYWAHQASGLRGSLLRELDRLEGSPTAQRGEGKLDDLIEQGFAVLERGAREI